jgi:hypothetical protein
LETFTGIVAETVEFPEASLALAERECIPLTAVKEFQLILYGAVITSAPRFAPSKINWTPTTPTLSLALAETVVVPETTEPPLGAEMLTVGAILSMFTVTLTPEEVVVLPAASLARAVME